MRSKADTHSEEAEKAVRDIRRFPRSLRPIRIRPFPFRAWIYPKRAGEQR
jgi:hypothetical protein